jgi:hypothetical protein
MNVILERIFLAILVDELEAKDIKTKVENFNTKDIETWYVDTPLYQCTYHYDQKKIRKWSDTLPSVHEIRGVLNMIQYFANDFQIKTSWKKAKVNSKLTCDDSGMRLTLYIVGVEA